MPAIETAAMPKIAGMARSYVPACTIRDRKGLSYKRHPVKRGLNRVPE
jgi:hypothetical protein